MADMELRRGLDRRALDRAGADCAARGATSRRHARRSYLYDAPDLSPRRVRRQTEILMIAIVALAALIGGWGLIALLHWLAVMLGSGLTTRFAPGTLGSVLMTLAKA